MLKQNLHNQICSQLPKPFVHGSNDRHAYSNHSLLSMAKARPKASHYARARRRCCRAVSDVDAGAIADYLKHEKCYTKVRAVVTVEESIVEMLTSNGILRGLDYVLGKGLLLELVSAELDPSKFVLFLGEQRAWFNDNIFSLRFQIRIL
ncbi:unnamed protein product [Linum tenue]|uniref:Uncharacterized protein n=1 Tax=Linum tenue TaxID=586396 RepID=A0AAV0JVY1_9ROSI|nr:unnamed protein product [Linum tenue]